MTLTVTYKPYKISLDRTGADAYIKISYPLKYGIYSQIETPDAVLQFNLNHEIVRARGKTADWIQPSEWLKRGMGNDWVYYSTGGYTGVFEATGEYYLPNLPYPTNALMGGTPLDTAPVRHIIENWHAMVGTLRSCLTRADPRVMAFLDRVLEKDPRALEHKSRQLRQITDGRITVMPPDARHVDYDIIPLTISHGCRYHCRFCRIQTGQAFSTLPLAEIRCKIEQLKEIYARDITNYNGVFLGQHDALNGDPDQVISAAREALHGFGLQQAYMKTPRLFLFGSVDSLLNAPVRLFSDLNGMGYETFINIGLESADPETLEQIGKPITREQVIQAFSRIQEINRHFDRVEITANFVMDEALPAGHHRTFLELVRDGVPRPRSKGAIYLSPLRINRPSRSALFRFNALKMQSRLPTFLYIIQRL